MSRRRLPPRLAAAFLVVGSVALTATGPVAADAPATEVDATSSWAASRSLQQHFGVEAARRLLHGGDVFGSRDAYRDALRGVERAAAIGTPEAVAFLVQLLQDTHGVARTDARILLATTRALAPFAGQRAVARALAEGALNAATAPPTPPGGPGDAPGPPPRDPSRRARVELARGTAALALAATREAHAVDLLLAAARRAGPGRSAATLALSAAPPLVVVQPPALTPEAVALCATIGDLRTADAVLEASRSLDAPLRTAGLHALGPLGDTRGLGLAEAATHDDDAEVRQAATEALVELGSEGAARAVEALIVDDRTAERGIELSTRLSADSLVGALASRVRASSDLPLRKAAVTALGKQALAAAVTTLGDLLRDPLLAGDAAEALARSRSESAWSVIATALARPPERRLGARMAALRGVVTGDLPSGVARSLRELAGAADGADRAVGQAALVLLGRAAPEAGLADPDPRVRRAVAMACEPTERSAAERLLARVATETDGPTLLVLSGGLAAMDDEATTTRRLADRVREGGIDAPLSSLALARRAREEDQDAVAVALASPDPVLRAHVARGLASAAPPWSDGLLAQAYETEVNAAVRRSIIAALATRRRDGTVPLRERALDTAARLDPEAAIRTLADRALRGLPPPALPSRGGAVWLRVMTGAGTPPSRLVTGVVLRADGLAVPVAFDGDGYALLPAPDGPARLMLAPGVAAYEAPLP